MFLLTPTETRTETCQSPRSYYTTLSCFDRHFLTFPYSSDIWIGFRYVWKCFSSVYEMFPESALFHANSNNIPRWSFDHCITYDHHIERSEGCLLCLNSAYLFLFFYWQIYMLIGTFGRSEKGEMLVVWGGGVEIMLNRLTFHWLQWVSSNLSQWYSNVNNAIEDVMDDIRWRFRCCWSRRCLGITTWLDTMGRFGAARYALAYKANLAFLLYRYNGPWLTQMVKMDSSHYEQKFP